MIIAQACDFEVIYDENKTWNGFNKQGIAGKDAEKSLTRYLILPHWFINHVMLEVS